MDALDEWKIGRENAKTVEEKQKFKVWDRLLDDVVPVIQAAISRRWFWFNNPLYDKVKYINVRIDMRDGHCIITDNDGNRINPEDLAHQRSYGRNE